MDASTEVLTVLLFTALLLFVLLAHHRYQPMVEDRGAIISAAAALAFLLSPERSSAFLAPKPAPRWQSTATAPFVSSGPAPLVGKRPRSDEQLQGSTPRLAEGRERSGRGQSHVLFLEPEDRDKAFELLEAYIERESESGERVDYDRVRGLVPHMRKRLWNAASKYQDAAADELGMDDFQYATKEFMPGLTSSPWWEPETFPWAGKLEEASPAIQEEYRALQALEESESQFRSSKEGGYTSQGWTHIPLVNAREPSDVYQSQRAHFPKTIKILRDLGIFANARAVLIGRQRPMSGIKTHSDGSNVVITCHLGLDIPGDEECLMWVGADMERRAWRNNKLLCMDTSYLHWTRNNTEQERIILLVMVWHPDMTAKEQSVLEYLDYLIRSAVAGEPLPLCPPVPVEEA